MRQGGDVTCGLPLTKSHDLLITWQNKTIIYPLSQWPLYKVGRWYITLSSSQPIALPDPSIAWSFKTMWQSKTFISPLSQCLWPPNVKGLLRTLRNYYWFIHMIFYPSGVAGSRKNLKAYLYYHNTYHNTQWSKNLTRWWDSWWHTIPYHLSTHKVAWSFNDAFLWGHNTN